jgi:hypothetical protein
MKWLITMAEIACGSFEEVARTWLYEAVTGVDKLRELGRRQCVEISVFELALRA